MTNKILCNTNNTKIKSIDILCIYLYTIASFRLFEYNVVPEPISRLSGLLSITIMLIYAIPSIARKNNSMFYGLMRWIVIWTFLSIVFAFVFFDQDVITGYRSTSVALSMCFFFYLYNRRIPIEFLKRYLLVWSGIYCVLWAYAFFHAPDILFGYMFELDNGGDVYDEQRGAFRVNLIGRQMLVFAWFVCFDALLKKQYKYFPFAILLYVVIIFQLTRQIILWTALISFLYFFYYHRLLIFTAIVCLIMGMGPIVSFLEKDDGVLGSMLLASQLEAENSEMKGENIRITEYRVCFKEWAPNPFAFVLGCGHPHVTSSYGKYETQWKARGIYLGDVGYGKIIVTTGLVGLLMFSILFYNCFRARVHKDVRFAQMYMIYLIPAHIACAWYCTPDGQIALAIGVYAIMTGKNNRNLKRTN